MSILASLTLSVTLGVTQFGTHPDGIWYQKPYPHTIRGVTSPHARLGVEHRQWSLGYAYLGQISMDALADPSDHNYEVSGPLPVAVDKLPRWVGKGSVQGPYVAYRFDLPRGFYVEPGLMATRMTWTQDVYGWYEHPNPEPRRDFHFSSTRWQPVPLLSVGYRLTERVSVQATGYFGVTLRGGPHPGQPGHDGKSVGTAFYNGTSLAVSLRVVL